LTESLLSFSRAARLQVSIDESALLDPYSDCNSRAVLIGSYWHDIFTKAIQFGIISCEATCEAPQAKCGSAASAVGTLLAFKEVPIGCMASEIASVTAGIDDYFGRCLKVSARMAASGISPETALSEKGMRGTGSSADAMACSVFCAMRAVDFKEAVKMASLCGSVSAVVGCTVGGWVGARMGTQGLPDEWIQKIESKSDLEALAKDIEDAFAERKKKRNDLSLMADYA
jgi:ADP-ribosylglycohydrolase